VLAGGGGGRVAGRLPLGGVGADPGLRGAPTGAAVDAAAGLSAASAGAAAAAVAYLYGRRPEPRLESAPPDGLVQLADARGAVTLHTPAGTAIPAAGFVPPGGTVATRGTESSVTLRLPDAPTSA